MTELNTVEIVVGVLAVISLVEAIAIRRIIKTADDDRNILLVLAKVKVTGQMGSLVENMKRGLENLFNPKDEIKKDGKKKTINCKTK